VRHSKTTPSHRPLRQRSFETPPGADLGHDKPEAVRFHVFCLVAEEVQERTAVNVKVSLVAMKSKEKTSREQTKVD